MVEINEEKRRQVLKLFEVWSSGKVDDAAPLVTDDFHLIDHAANEQHVGIEAVKSFFARFETAVADSNWELREFFADESGDVVVVRWDLFVTFNESGNALVVPGVSRLAFRDGLVCEENDYYSPMQFVAEMQVKVRS